MSLPARLAPWLQFAQASAGPRNLDPLLLLAIIDRESLGGMALKPQGPGGTGDGGHGHGLMQIDDRYHTIFISQRLADGSFAWQDPARNIEEGATLLALAMAHFEGERDAEFFGTASYNAGAYKVQSALASVTRPATDFRRRQAADSVTTGRDYAESVFGKRDRLKQLMSLPTQENEDG